MEMLDNTKFGFGIGPNGMITLWQKVGDYKWEYIKNVSKTQEEADIKYPGLTQFNFTGSHWIIPHSEKQELCNDTKCFAFGKYKGDRIDDCDDFKYIEWYINQSVQIDDETLNNTYRRIIDNSNVYPVITEEYIEWFNKNFSSA